MASQLRLRRGTTAQHSTFTGASGEVTVDTTKKTLVVHDGTTAGGVPLVRNGGSDNVGIGTSSPKTRLQSTAGANLNAPSLGSATNAPLYVTNTDPAYGLLSGVSAGDGHAWLQAQRTDGTATAYNITLNEAGGNVGIGTSSPSVKLDVNGVCNFGGSSGVRAGVGTAFATGQAELYAQGTVPLGVGTAGNTSAQFYTNSTERMRITSTGDVGIGTSSPGQRLVLQGSANQAFMLAQDSTGAVQGIYGADSVAGGAILGALSNHPVIFRTNNTERARFDSAGNFLVGTASGFTDTSFTVVTSGSRHAGNFENNNVDTYAALVVRNNATSGTRRLIDFRQSSTTIGSITHNGTSTSYNTSSDYRLKEDIAPMTGALAKVAALKPVTYKWKADGSDGEGFIAHELQEVVPDAVTGEKDATRMEQYEISPAVPATYDEEGNELTPAVVAVMGEREVPVYQGIDTSFLVATLTAAIQEQQAMIEQLKADVTALKAASATPEQGGV